MCGVHLIEQGRETRQFTGENCCSCEGPIDGIGILVWGKLDDGTHGTYTFYYHSACADGLEYDEGEDGCFTYGSPVSVS